MATDLRFDGKTYTCVAREVYVSRCKVGDFIQGPNGILLRVATVQPDCPVWESPFKTFTAVLLESESKQTFPVRPTGKLRILRPRKS